MLTSVLSAGCLLRPRRSVLAAGICPVRDATKVQGAAHKVISHTRTILTPSAAHEDDAVLLDVVALAGDIRGDLATVRETDTGRLALARVGLLGTLDADLDADALEVRAFGVGKRGGDGVASSLALTAALKYGLAAHTHDIPNASRQWVKGCDEPVRPALRLHSGWELRRRDVFGGRDG